MNVLKTSENEFEKVLVTNSFYTIFETKAFISFKGNRFQFKFDEISNIRIIKKEKNIFPIQFFLVSTTMFLVVFSVFEKDSLYQFVLLAFSALFFIATFFIKKVSYTLCVDKKRFEYNRFSIKSDKLDDVELFVKTIRKIKYKNSKK
jgi:hypothetical protein